MLEYWREHREQFRQSENQRAVLTIFVPVIAAALTGFIMQTRLCRKPGWPLPPYPG